MRKSTFRYMAIVMADVSGKDVPAALFMVNAKQTIQRYIRDIPDLASAVITANNSLCEHNDSEMFDDITMLCLQRMQRSI